ncbi:uncharacterized protein V1510DRAFT_417707 [Dipodascopsis tothii]|uniref:uncharacterized protein n=1 Tax=Dipodascopsis tothii TaxID=44089 RepID=UPI0034CF580C
MDRGDAVAREGARRRGKMPRGHPSRMECGSDLPRAAAVAAGDFRGRRVEPAARAAPRAAWSGVGVVAARLNPAFMPAPFRPRPADRRHHQTRPCPRQTPPDRTPDRAWPPDRPTDSPSPTRPRLHRPAGRRGRRGHHGRDHGHGLRGPGLGRGPGSCRPSAGAAASYHRRWRRRRDRHRAGQWARPVAGRCHPSLSIVGAGSGSAEQKVQARPNGPARFRSTPALARRSGGPRTGT